MLHHLPNAAKDIRKTYLSRGEIGLQILQDRLQHVFSVLLVIADMRDQERDPGRVLVVLTVSRVVLGGVYEEESIWREHRIQDHPASGSTVRNARSQIRDAVGMEAVEDCCQGMIVVRGIEKLHIWSE